MYTSSKRLTVCKTQSDAPNSRWMMNNNNVSNNDEIGLQSSEPLKAVIVMRFRHKYCCLSYSYVSSLANSFFSTIVLQFATINGT